MLPNERATSRKGRQASRDDRRARDERAAQLVGILKRSEVAKLSGIHRTTLWRRLKAMAQEQGEAS